LPEAARPEDERPRALAEPRPGVLDRSVRRQAATPERRRLDGVEVSDRIEVAARGHEYVLRIATVLEEPGLAGVGADHLLAAPTEPTLAASPRGVDEDVAEFVVFGGDLVPEDERKLGAEEVLGDMEVRMTDAAGEHPDHGLIVGARSRYRALFHLEWCVEGAKNDCPHGFLRFRQRT
jgi:hypothetical protein